MPPPARVLFLRPDTYGDLVLFEPTLRRLRAAWGERTEIGVLVREPFLDFTPLVAVPGVRWFTVGANPYRDPVDGPAAAGSLRELREVLEGTFRPDCLVAPCSGKSWLEAAAGMLLPGVRQVGLGRFDLDPAVLDATARALGSPPGAPVPALFAEVVATDPAAAEWQQQAAVADRLLGLTTPSGANGGEDGLPRLAVPAGARAAAGTVLAAAGLTPGGYAVCAAAGVANVQIKAWPPERFGETLAWLGREHGVPALLVGHEREAERLETVRQAARASGGGPEPAIWLGRDGEMPTLAALIASARFYFGNDTGAIHLAAALDVALVGVYGGGAGLRFRPAARARSWTVVQPLPCFGCAWDCFFGDAPCVGTITTASVRGALERLLAAERDGGAPPPEIVEVGGLAPAAREVVDRVAPRFHAVRTESASRYRQVRELDALARRRELERDEIHAAAGTEATTLHADFARAEADASARREQVERLTGLLRESETDREARVGQIAKLGSQLAVAEAHASARRGQVDKLTSLLRESETDRAARVGQITRLGSQLAVEEANASARSEQVEQLTGLLRESEKDRKARGLQIAELGSQLAVAEANASARREQVEQLTGLLRESETDREARGTQIAALTAWLQESEADRAARGEQIVVLTALCHAAQAGGSAAHATAPGDA